MTTGVCLAAPVLPALAVDPTITECSLNSKIPCGLSLGRGEKREREAQKELWVREEGRKDRDRVE